MGGHLGQVSRQRRQLADRPGRQGHVQTLVKLGRTEPPVASGNTEYLNCPVPICIGGPKLRLRVHIGTSRREIGARHVRILKDIERIGNLARFQGVAAA
jgi:hypothetical protein